MIHKKMMAGLMLFIFVMSVIPVALAEEDTSNELDVDTEMDSIEKQHLEEARKDRLTQKALDKRQEAKDRKHLLLGKEVREKIKESINDRKVLREKLIAIKEKNEEVKEQYKLHRKHLAKLKDVLGGCNTEDCKSEAKEKYNDAAQDHVLKMVDVMKRSLDKLKEHLGLYKDLTDDEKDNILSLVDGHYETLSSLEERVNNGESLREVVNELKELRKEINKLRRHTSSLLTAHKIKTIVEKHTNLVNGMEKRIQFAEGEGYDTTNLKDIAARFRENFDNLEDLYSDIQEKWEVAQQEKTREAYGEVRKAREEVKETLKESRKLLREFVSELNSVMN